jgi:TRAP transporter TAXI family solute receptor
LAQDFRFLRIATGATGSTNFAIGGLIASAVSNPPGSRPCERGGSCGVPSLIAVAQATEGSVENVEAIAEGRVESGLVQADVLYWAYHGTGLFQDKGPARGLRAIANLFPATVHIVVRRDSGIYKVSDLKGRRVSLGEPGSGALVTARAILAAFDLSEQDVGPSYHKPGPASDLLYEGDLDAFFVVGGVPVSAIADLAERLPILLVPISGMAGEELKSFYPFFTEAVIQAGSYLNVGHAVSVGINTQWVASADADADFVYALTKALWHERSRALFERGHAEGRSIRLESALDRIAIPLHDGSARFYAEIGLHR